MPRDDVLKKNIDRDCVLYAERGVIPEWWCFPCNDPNFDIEDFPKYVSVRCTKDYSPVTAYTRESDCHYVNLKFTDRDPDEDRVVSLIREAIDNRQEPA